MEGLFTFNACLPWGKVYFSKFWWQGLCAAKLSRFSTLNLGLDSQSTPKLRYIDRKEEVKNRSKAPSLYAGYPMICDELAKPVGGGRV